MDLISEASRLRVLWKSGRDKYVSFFAVLNEVRKEIGDDKLADFCFDNLRISLSVILDARKLLTEHDRDIVKGDLAAATKAIQEQTAAAKKARELERRQEELARAEHLKKLAAIRAEAAQQEVKRKKIEDTEKTRQRRRSNPNMFGPIANAQAMKRRLLNKIGSLDIDELTKRYARAHEECIRGELYWVEGSIAKALILQHVRGANEADQHFSDALAALKIQLSHQDRAALLGLIGLGENAMRKALIEDSSRSYRAIWEKHKPILKIVD